MSNQRNGPWSGGCQCGAVRFRVEALGRPSFCHCRMCQKAFGATGGALVTATGVTWTRGATKHFQSSATIRRGFCADCGTPLTFEYATGFDIAIATFDRAAEIAPIIQYSPQAALPWAASVHALPGYPPEEHEKRQIWMAAIKSNQHPDHDTDTWPCADISSMKRAMTVLQVHDLQRSLDFYCGKLGFQSHGSWGTPPVFAIVQRGSVTFALDQSRDGSTPPIQQYWSAYIYVADADAMAADCKAHGVVLHREICDTEYGRRDFDIRDPDGHILAFGQVLAPDAMGPGLSGRHVGRRVATADTSSDSQS